jgi:hypothetical protein
VVNLLSLLGGLTAFFSSLPELKNSKKTFRVVVDHSKSLEELIEEGGYARVHPFINPKNFGLGRSNRVEEVELELIKFERALHYTQARYELIWILKRERASFRELLSLGAQYPYLDREGPIVALTPSWHHPAKTLLLPFIGKKGLGLWFATEPFPAGTRFLVRAG